MQGVLFGIPGVWVLFVPLQTCRKGQGRVVHYCGEWGGGYSGGNIDCSPFEKVRFVGVLMLRALALGSLLGPLQANGLSNLLRSIEPHICVVQMC